MKLKCLKCNKEVGLELSESGPHIKASCVECGAYIKFISERELTGDKNMSEFEVSFRLEGNEYGDCIILQKYGDNYGLISGFISNKTDTPVMRWCFPQGKDKKPRDKGVPWKINLGNLVSARRLLSQALAALPNPERPKGMPELKDKGDSQIPF